MRSGLPAVISMLSLLSFLLLVFEETKNEVDKALAGTNLRGFPSACPL